MTDTETLAERPPPGSAVGDLITLAGDTTADAVRPGDGPDPLAALRAEATAAIKADALSVQRAAREVGVGGSTLSAWLNGTYSGDDDAVGAKVGAWLDARRARAATRAAMPRDPGFVPTPSARAFLGVLDHAQHTPDLALVSGGAGVGKTTAAREYARTNPNVFLLTAQPAMRDAGPRMVLDELAEALGVREARSSQKIVRALVARLRDTRALVVIDEAQNLSTRALDQVRSVHDLAEVGVALVGNEEVHGRLEGTARTPDYAQLFSRVGMRISRPASRSEDVEALLDAWGVAREGDVRPVLRDVARECGALRGAVKTLRLAHRMLGADEGATALTGRHVRLAWRKLSSSPKAAATAPAPAAAPAAAVAASAGGRADG